MEGEESILEALNEDDIFEDGEDVDMLDVEEGELVEEDSLRSSGQCNVEDITVTNQESQSKNQKRRGNKKKKKKRNRFGGAQGPNVTDINRFVLDTCKRLKEKKSYMVYTAVGCLGVSAVFDLVKEVDAIQACGGQMTADGRRHRNGGGVLWAIIKAREPKAYKEIMKKAKEFEKQFQRPNMKRPIMQGSSNTEDALVEKSVSSVSEDLQGASEVCVENEKRAPVHERLRAPVSYDDDLLRDDEA